MLDAGNPQNQELMKDRSALPAVSEDQRAQDVLSSILTLVGLTIIYFRVSFLGFTVLPPDMSAMLTVLWVPTSCT